MSRTIKEYLLVSAKGAFMGIANIMPGVSGGTIAYISGVYDEFINSVKLLGPLSLRNILKKNIKQFWGSINGTFLLALLFGMLASIFIFAKILSVLLVKFPIPVWSFFFGLIIASSAYLASKIKEWRIGTFLSIIVGIGITIVVTYFSPVANSGDPEYWYVLLTGAISICALSLPRISGSIILLLLGQYQFIISSVIYLRIDYLLIFGFGSLVGILAFSNGLTILLKKYYSRTVGFLVGVMVGSLNKVWPWKHTLLSHTNQYAQIIPDKQENVLPFSYFELTGKDPLLLYAILMIISGTLIVFLVESSYNKAKTDKMNSNEPNY
ncbi:MAG: DUF368 domain-containing protein [Bacteroidales bacterium]